MKNKSLFFIPERFKSRHTYSRPMTIALMETTLVKTFSQPRDFLSFVLPKIPIFP